MACKLKCPKCEKVLKEEGDEGKKSQGEYRVHINGYEKADGTKLNLVECLACGHKNYALDFDR